MDRMREIMNMCDDGDMCYSLQYISKKIQEETDVPHIDVDEYKAHVLSVRNDIDYLGNVSPKIIAASGNLHHIECSSSSTVMIYLADYGNIQCIQHMYEKNVEHQSQHRIICDHAAKFGHLELLKYLLSKKPYKGKNILCNAAFSGNVELIEYLHQNNYFWHYPYACGYAERAGSLEALIYLHENGHPLGGSDCDIAISNGHLHILEYLNENGCHPNGKSYKLAVEKGHLDIVKYLHETGCPHYNDLCAIAAIDNSIDILKYLHENGYPITSDVLRNAHNADSVDCFNYAIEHKFPGRERYSYPLLPEQ